MSPHLYMADAQPVRGTNAPRTDTGRVSWKNRVNEKDPRVCVDPSRRVLPHLADPRPASSSRLSSPCCRSLLSPSSCGSWSLHSTWGMSTCEHSQRLRGQRGKGEKGSDPLLPPLRPRAPPCAAALGWGPPGEACGAGTGTTRRGTCGGRGLRLERRRTEAGRPGRAGVRAGGQEGRWAPNWCVRRLESSEEGEEVGEKEDKKRVRRMDI